MAASYDLNNFIAACGNNNQVILIGNAKKTASEDFGLHTTKDVLDFISNGGLENINFLNTKTWDNKPHTIQVAIFVDAYSFHSGSKHGYLAIMFNPATKKWLIKSFKLNKDSIPRGEYYNQLLNIKTLIQKPDEK
ncbi:MAG: hypothetical protein HOO93_17680 [Methyloglobulus sp.]|nr:hypothetical protein [Methyloglobulus sp.]